MLLLVPPSQCLNAAVLPLCFHPTPTPRSRAPPPPPAVLHFPCSNYYSVVSSQNLTTTSISAKKLPFKPPTATRSSSSSKEARGESAFFDEDGVVQDMDGYLNYLSLEYDSVWDTKPTWCQPWTITLTGILLIGGSWLFLHSLIVTAGVTGLICAWWYVFLCSYPKAYLEMIAERRKKVTSGVEDTYGSRGFESQAEGGDAGPRF